MDDLAFVLRAVWEARAKWYNIGLELGLTPGTLDAIKLANQDDPDRCIRETLKTWLSQSEHPTWSDLARALRVSPVGHGKLAEELLKFEPSN